LQICFGSGFGSGFESGFESGSEMFIPDRIRIRPKVSDPYGSGSGSGSATLVRMHQRYKLDPDSHQFTYDKPQFIKYEPFEYFFRVFSFYLEARIRIWIQIRIKVKGTIRIRIRVTSRIRRIKVTSSIRIRINMMRIRITGSNTQGGPKNT
jgi:hypothetical protein